MKLERHVGEEQSLLDRRRFKITVWFSSCIKLWPSTVYRGLAMSRNDCEDHGASTSDPHTVENRVLRRTSPTSADLFEIVAVSHSEFKRSIIASTVHRPQYPVQRDYYCASELTVSSTLFLSRLLSPRMAGFVLVHCWVLLGQWYSIQNEVCFCLLKECKYSFYGIFLIQCGKKTELGLNDNDFY